MSYFPDHLYHATRRGNIDSIIEKGLQVSYYGEMHGEMDYRPAGPSVYLSASEESGNLNGNLFNAGIENVVLIKIDPAHLDPDRVYPDDLLMFILDEDFLVGCDDPDDLDGDLITAFATRFSLEPGKAERILSWALRADSEKAYPWILQEMWPEYLATEGEIAYLGSVPAQAILGWRDYPRSEPENSFDI